MVLTIASGPLEDKVKHFRLRRDTVHRWLPEVPDHRAAGNAPPTGISATS
ncbi:MAG: hypothetical protein JXX28_00510 [Deltaproteobacteria bacterium]|nr:hypothetical protein [Deltaproteobacteria bacterium]